MLKISLNITKKHLGTHLRRHVVGEVLKGSGGPDVADFPVANVARNSVIAT